MIRLAFKLSIIVSVCRGIIQNVIFRADDIVIAFIINIFVWTKETLFSHWSFVQKNGYPLIIQYVFANPRSLETAVHYHMKYFRKFQNQSVVQSFENCTVIDISCTEELCRNSKHFYKKMTGKCPPFLLFKRMCRNILPVKAPYFLHQPKPHKSEWMLHP